MMDVHACVQNRLFEQKPKAFSAWPVLHAKFRSQKSNSPLSTTSLGP